MICSGCGKTLESMEGAAFCPFCGAALNGGPQGVNAPTAVEDPQAVNRVMAIKEEKDPAKRHTLLLEAQATYPHSLAVAEELLFLGRLYLRGSRNVDFSIIKCYLLMIYLKPEDIKPQRQDELRRELFSHPQLDACLALADDKEAFLYQYLLRLSREFIDLFLRGDSRYMRRIFGFGMDSHAPKNLAEPTASMLLRISRDETLAPSQREMLAKALYQAFADDLRDTTFLNERLRGLGLSLPQ